ncbi:hypothetical protein [Mycobacterium avium]|uniref:hypothetical protein n=1 Tax=Mycobacterium avium TaxID=1764 RepID=UPI001CC7FC39|nr:hypothetical protein [Mycobacterium avium]MBZ4619393.1 hypothetical protein [Mycobacterium avium subsp. hominissuis]
MTTIGRSPKARNLVTSIERGLDRILTNPTDRLQKMRQELEREEGVRRHRVEIRSRETRETLEMAARYLSSLPSS